jgi:hypothetical protein
MPQTYQRLGQVVLGSDTNTVTFSSIPQTYTDLVVDISGKSASNSNFGDEANVYLNNSSSSITNIFQTAGTDSTMLSTRSTIGLPWAPFYVAGTSNTNWGNAKMQIFNYTNSGGSVGSFYSHGASTNTQRFLRYGAFWHAQPGINRLDFYISSGNPWLAGSTFRLYGILRAA